MIVHPIPPVFDRRSEILILGSFPSVRSRESGFFYGHPRNRFWRVTAACFGCETPETIPEKKRFLLEHHLAVWDVIAACEIEGSADSAIRRPVPNDLSVILNAAPVRRILTNGQTAKKYYDRLILPGTGREAVCLPSTSPANAAKSLEELIDIWRGALTDL